LDDAFEPLTYAYYRKVKKGTAPKNAPIFIDKSKLKQNADKEKIKCTACSYFYDESKEDAKFSGLPDSWKCPVCRLGKEDFIKF